MNGGTYTGQPIPSPPFAWTCPHCGRDTTTVYSNHVRREFSAGIALGPPVAADVIYILCPNQQCKKLTLFLELWRVENWRENKKIELLQQWRLLPPSNAKVFPEYVPSAIRQDYTEACIIREASPKASATLARRCLQAMIRDYWKVKAGRLVEEIAQIAPKVDPSIFAAIDSVRKVGNIGAHIEKDVNLVIDVEPEEASALIWLIEVLIKDWYINSHEREEKLAEIKAIATAKDAAKGKAQWPTIKPSHPLARPPTGRIQLQP